MKIETQASELQRGSRSRGTPLAPLAESSQRGGRLPLLQPSPRFLLFAHMDAWKVSGGRVVPEWNKAPITPGLNGVSDEGRNRSAELVKVMGERGWQLVDEVKAGGYCVAHEVPSGTAHTLPWEVPVNGRKRMDVDHDLEAECYDAWVAAGLIAPADQIALEALRERLQRSHDHAAQAPQAMPGRAAEYARSARVIAAQLAVVDAEIAKLTAPAVPDEDAEPAPPRGRKAGA
jgi:hypothetical protein